MAVTEKPAVTEKLDWFNQSSFKAGDEVRVELEATEKARAILLCAKRATRRASAKSPMKPAASRREVWWRASSKTRVSDQEEFTLLVQCITDMVSEGRRSIAGEMWRTQREAPLQLHARLI